MTGLGWDSRRRLPRRCIARPVRTSATTASPAPLTTSWPGRRGPGVSCVTSSPPIYAAPGDARPHRCMGIATPGGGSPPPEGGCPPSWFRALRRARMLRRGYSMSSLRPLSTLAGSPPFAARVRWAPWAVPTPAAAAASIPAGHRLGPRRRSTTSRARSRPTRPGRATSTILRATPDRVGRDRDGLGRRHARGRPGATVHVPAPSYPGHQGPRS